MDISTYHNDFSRDSNSSLRLFEDSREAYAAIRVYRTQQPRPQTPAMLRGSILDSLVLDDSVTFDKRFVVAPVCDRRTKQGKATWEAFVSTVGNRTVIDEDDWCLAFAMREGVMRNQWARHWLESDGWSQKTFEWEHGATGLPLKCRPDRMLKNGLVGDLKMTGRSLKPDAFVQTMRTFCYHGQAALYLDGTCAGPWVWVVVSDEPPHECAVYAMGPRTLIAGRNVNERTLRALAECKASGDWSGEFSKDLHEVELPEWELRKWER